MSSLAQPVAASSATGVKRPRIESVDIVRGVVMILMALDHTREFFGNPSANPTDLESTTVALFFTRWITHFCAPTFFLLTGTGAFLATRRKSRTELSRFLFTRGLWLIFLELVVTRDLGWQFNFDYHVTVLLVLWALGWAMIALSVLVFLPPSVVGAVGVIMIAVHNLLDPVRSTNWLWSILHVPGLLVSSPRFTLFVAYPLIPWVGVTAAGYSLGQIYNWPAEHRRAFLLRAGIAITTLFVILRAVNIYGDPSRWTQQKSAVFTALSFIRTTKYPPSLLFLLMTLGPAMLLLWKMDFGTPRWMKPALIFGKVPMFYYLLHIPLIHLFAIAVCYQRYGQVHWMFESNNIQSFPFTSPPGWGYSLPVIYLVWVIAVVGLYPLCRWFSGLRQRSSAGWLSYF
ncbi:MAG TPA: heparan-alpha-glucosaminide N-acetyltransferase domain-containing protein [Candidatus Sulfotelmatobacter sp.]|nr:heparan-alpha-glucosaminide N-acetyltransferase domain-containing protein [Candidatus Sulfotelmatobacter sp.]